MSQDNPPLSAPTFHSQVPPGLLEGLDDRDKYLYRSVDEMRQCQAWLMSRAVTDANTLEEIKTQVKKTNGRTSASEVKIEDLKDQQVAAEPAIKAMNFILTLAHSKIFWVIFIIFLVAGVPWLITHTPGIVEAILGS